MIERIPKEDSNPLKAAPVLKMFVKIVHPFLRRDMDTRVNTYGMKETEKQISRRLERTLIRQGYNNIGVFGVK